MHTHPTRRTMKDVDHTPPTGESVTNVWHRGQEMDGDDLD